MLQHISPSRSAPTLGPLARRPDVPRQHESLQKINAIQQSQKSGASLRPHDVSAPSWDPRVYDYAPTPDQWPYRRSVSTPLTTYGASMRFALGHGPTSKTRVELSPPTTTLRMRAFQPDHTAPENVKGCGGHRTGSSAR